MADRPKGYGMTAELQEKKDAKYNPELAKQACDWIAAVTGESAPADVNPGSVQEWLKNGKILCSLINALQPGSVKKINDSTMAFKMMENVGNYLAACETYGVPKTDLFQTVDLYEGQNMPLVIDGIIALGRKAGAKGYDGPTIGPKEAQGEKREWSEEQLKAGQNVIGLQMGSNKGASQSGMTFGQQRQIH